MRGTDLRIGNLVFAVGVGDVEMSKLDNTTKYEQIQPIRLTEEWLIKFGFERTSFGRKKGAFILEAGSRIVNTDELIGFSWEKVFDKEYLSINYVHQLQNLYFVLHEQELTRVDG